MGQLLCRILATIYVTVCFFSDVTYGFTNLQSTLTEACIGEEVTFFCATTSSRLRWQVTLSDRRIPAVSHTFFTNSEPGGPLHPETTRNGVLLQFGLVSYSMGILNSTLVFTASDALNNAEIDCQGVTHRFKLAGVPPQPMNVTLSHRVYGTTTSNVTASWCHTSAGRIDLYRVNITYYGIESTLLMTHTPSIMVVDIPYNQSVALTVTSVNCYSENEGNAFTTIINKCPNTAPQNGHIVNDSSTVETSIPGEEIVFTCNLGYSPQILTTAVCLDEGIWSTDPKDIFCLIVCPLPALNDILEIINESTNGSVLGSKLRFRCKNDSGSVIQIATCVEDGQWFPNPENYTCQVEDYSNSDTTNADQVPFDGNQLTTILMIAGGTAGGVLLCVLVVVCATCMCTCIIQKRRRVRLEQLDYAATTEPVYETIVDPSYAGLCDIRKETELMFNDAYNFGMCKQDQYSQDQYSL